MIRIGVSKSTAVTGWGFDSGTISSWTFVSFGGIIYRKGIRSDKYVIDKSVDGGVTWQLNLIQLEPDEDLIIINIDAGVAGYRHLVRLGAYCIDMVLTATGFAGIENIDWVNVYNMS